MTDISNTEYIIITKDGISVGGVPATTYRGYPIQYIKDIKKDFTVVQKRNPEVQELHVSAFETKGEDEQPGTPSGKFGPNAWWRVKLFDDRIGPWVFCRTYGSASDCAYFCARNCSIHVSCISNIRSTLFNFAKTGKEK